MANLNNKIDFVALIAVDLAIGPVLTIMASVK